MCQVEAPYLLFFGAAKKAATSSALRVLNTSCFRGQTLRAGPSIPLALLS